MIDWPSFLSPDARIDFWTMAVGIVCNTSCAILGCFLVLRRMSLLGDAISHSVIAGIGVAFLLTGQITIIPMFLGALTVGVLTAFLTQTLHTFGKVPEDSSMGVVFTSLFALGVIIISQVNVHLDTDCVLFGRLDVVSLDVITVFGFDVPRALQTLVPVLGLTLLFTVAFWKELKISSFDPMLATAMGLSAGLVHYLLMGMVATVTVASLEAVGAIVVVAMLIVPAATAHLLTDRLNWMVFYAVLAGAFSALFGCLWARHLDTNAAGMMAVVAGLQFTAAVFLSPRYGLISKFFNNFRLALRIVREDIIAKIYRLEEKQADEELQFPVTSRQCLGFGGGGFLARVAVPILKHRGEMIQAGPGQYRLTEKGRRLGVSLVRSHRLWEAYLDEHFDLPADHLHEPAEQIEHYIGPDLQER
ncbi:MAG: metal ABC transporter permease, partial [Planctomycetes bacterium]|nr:metal ABC transporter permease [Planctomycetota bacterium]